jgi:hypothetical protein
MSPDEQAPDHASAEQPQTHADDDEQDGPEEAVAGRPVAPSTLEEQLDIYPLREKSEDPRWAIGIVWTWTGIALLSILGILVLILLGFFYK